MKFEQAMQELREEAVTQGALENTIQRVRSDRRSAKRTLRRGLIFAVGVTAVAAFAVLPWRKGDLSWAQVRAQLMEAKILHIKIRGVENGMDGEVWVHDNKVKEANSNGDIRMNGKLITSRTGTVSSYKPQAKNEGYYLHGYTNFQIALGRLKSGTATGKPVTIDGKKYTSYRFNSSTIVFGPDSKAKPSVYVYLTVFVDNETNRIVRIKEETEETPYFAEFKRSHKFTLSKDWLNHYRMDAVIDYPESIDDSIFDPPANAFDHHQSFARFESALKSNIGEANVAGQKVTLHGVFFDGMYVSVVWSGVAGNFMTNDRFQIEGVSTGDKMDVRCLSSGKIAKASTSKIPYCLQSSKVLTAMPTSVNLSLPVFAIDKSQPYPGLKKGKGYLSKKVGVAEFYNVPVTLSLWIATYQKQFGLQKDWW